MKPSQDPLDSKLQARLLEIALDPRRLGDPSVAWRRLHERFGRRVTLIDRYALEAAHRGVRIADLDPAIRERLSLEVLSAQFPGITFVVGSERAVRDPVEILAYDARWSKRFAEWRERLVDAVGRVAMRVEHIGSTSVPGLAAKPVIDIQISVHDVENENAYLPAIESTGVPLRVREPGHRYCRASGDRPREVQIHVCDAGSTWERDHLLFRDYLRSCPAACEAYVELKRQLAIAHRDDRLAYNEAKTAFILDTLDSANAWATRTGWAPPIPAAQDGS